MNLDVVRASWELRKLRGVGNNEGDGCEVGQCLTELGTVATDAVMEIGPNVARIKKEFHSARNYNMVQLVVYYENPNCVGFTLPDYQRCCHV